MLKLTSYNVYYITLIFFNNVIKLHYFGIDYLVAVIMILRHVLGQEACDIISRSHMQYELVNQN